MSILKIARMGHPVLHLKARELSPDEIRADDTQRLVDNMIATMHEYSGVGLAAPQVHESKRLIIIECQSADPESKRPLIPLTVLFNVKIVSHSSETEEDWEGCLSIPEIRGWVPRYRSIEVQGRDRQAKEVKFKASGFFARVLQHETDHLDGILFPERMKDLTKLTFLEEFYRFQNDPSDVDR